MPYKNIADKRRHSREWARRLRETDPDIPNRYARAYRERRRNGQLLSDRATGGTPATCHPERPTAGRGLCRNCYVRIWNKEHPPTDAQRRQRRDYMRARDQANAQMLNRLKLASGCVDCGYNANSVALHFDHVRGTKTREISAMRGSSPDRILAEVAKCDVRCANCHAIKSAKEAAERFPGVPT